MSLENKNLSAEEELTRLSSLLTTLKEKEDFAQKIAYLDSLPEVSSFFSQPSLLKELFPQLSQDQQYVIKALFAIKQGTHIFSIPEELEGPLPLLEKLLGELLKIEDFYADVGGLVGYHFLSLSLLVKGEDFSAEEEEKLCPPKGIDLSKETPKVRSSVLEGIRNQEMMGELYPVGGAADRLGLKDEKTEENLPAARLVFLGKGLLEGVITDLEAREYLFYRLFGKQIFTPIGLMTSHVNQNNVQIQRICQQSGWFGRPRDSLRFFSQPSVPTFTRNGKWCLAAPLKLLLKPGGHGVMWKLAQREGVIDWFKEKKRSRVLVRQINNPMAGIDYGLLAFLGIGHEGDKLFGFASCPRRINAQEGMNVLKLTSSETGRRALLTNIEYCEFERFGIKDQPQKGEENFSQFPSNTNILFANLSFIQKAVKKSPYPGLLLNFREAKCYDVEEGEKEREVARLESTMQNIADALPVDIGEDTPEQFFEHFPTYLTFNVRRKTISATKKKKNTKNPLLETPEGSFYDYLLNCRELLETHCRFVLPPAEDEEEFLKRGPSFILSYHPALGPLYSIIGQKIQKGKVERGSSLHLEIADLYIENLILSGSLVIRADAIMGHKDNEGVLRFSHKTGRCSLKNVQVVNEGIEEEKKPHFWKGEKERKERVEIILHGHAEFIAENITFEGPHLIEVEEGMRVIAEAAEGKISFKKEPLKELLPFWNYKIDSDQRILIEKQF